MTSVARKGEFTYYQPVLMQPGPTLVTLRHADFHVKLERLSPVSHCAQGEERPYPSNDPDPVLEPVSLQNQPDDDSFRTGYFACTGCLSAGLKSIVEGITLTGIKS